MSKIDVLLALMFISIIAILYGIINYNFMCSLGWIVVIILSISIIEDQSEM